MSKAYYAMKTGQLEKHIRRVVWRWGDREQDWRTFTFVAVSFWDRPAATLLHNCVNLCFTLCQEIGVMAAERVKRDNIMNDIITGGTAEEVKRFKGIEDENQRCNGTVSEIMASGGLQLKAMVVSGEEDGPALEKLGGAVLGLGFSTKKDLLFVRCKANFSPRKRNQPTGPDLRTEDLAALRLKSLTMRIYLGVCNSQYDPLGLASPLVIRLKVGMKLLHQAELS